MRDQEFTALDPPAATAALTKVPDEAERERLRLLYAHTRGMLVDGTGWMDAPKPKPAPVDPNVVRPFGMLGSAYRVNAVGRICYRASLLCVPLTIAAADLARHYRVPIRGPLVLLVAISLIGALLVAVVLNGKKIPATSDA